MEVGTILTPQNSSKHDPSAEGFAAMGQPVPEKRRDAAYQWLRSINVGREQAWSTVETMAEHIQRDHPHEAMEAARKNVDLTGAYRLLALLLTGAACLILSIATAHAQTVKPVTLPKPPIDHRKPLIVQPVHLGVPPASLPPQGNRRLLPHPVPPITKS